MQVNQGELVTLIGANGAGKTTTMKAMPLMVEKIFEVVREISLEGLTMLLVEPHARLALQAANRGYVMDSGDVTMSGDAQAMLDDPKVREAYLGE